MTGSPDRLGLYPTPLERADRLGGALGLKPGQLLIKRDDLCGFAEGGTKIRKLEFLLDEARRLGSDVLVTAGGIQSNHVRATAAAASAAGLRCEAVLAGDASTAAGGNLMLTRLFGARFSIIGSFSYEDLEHALEERCRELEREGHRPYLVPIGGAGLPGSYGDVQLADELLEQEEDFDAVVVADGSGGTHAGLCAGLGSFERVIGVDVGARPEIERFVVEHAFEITHALGRPEPTGECRVDSSQVGDGYARPTEATLGAMSLAARVGGVIVDPIYTGKALAALVSLCRSREFRAGKVIFLHSGGAPAVYSVSQADAVSRLIEMG